MADLDRILATIDRGLDDSVTRLFALARIPSISTDPEHKDECRKAALWLDDALKGLGFTSIMRHTPGLPPGAGSGTAFVSM